MRILILNHFPLEGSGSGVYTQNLAEQLSKMGHDVKVVVPEHEPITNDLIQVRSVIFRNGNNSQWEVPYNFPCFTTHPRSNNTFENLTQEEIQVYISTFQKILQQEVEEFKPDIIHAQHLWILPYCASKTGIPYIATAHGTDLKGFRADERYREYALVGARKASKIITISNQVDREVEELYGIPKESRSLIFNGFDNEIFYPMKRDRFQVLSKYYIHEEPEYIVTFVGKLAHFKGVDVLLRAAKIYERELKSVITFIIGNGDQYQNLLDIKTELELKHIHFLGHRSQGSIAELLSIADVSTVPSRVEPFGLVAIEALACGTPVVATNQGGLPDFIDSRVGSLVPVEDDIALAEAIIREVTNPNKSEKSKFAARYSHEGFSWDRVAREVENIYREVLENEL